MRGERHMEEESGALLPNNFEFDPQRREGKEKHATIQSYNQKGSIMF